LLFINYKTQAIVKRLLPLLILSILLSNQLSGQWYERHHRVSDPKDLSLEQFSVSKKKAGLYLIIKPSNRLKHPHHE